MASGVIRRLNFAGFRVIALEKEKPECVRRAVSFAEAVYDGEKSVEGVTAKRANSEGEIDAILIMGNVPILVDPGGEFLTRKTGILIDARMLKRDIDTKIDMAQIVIGLGPGFTVDQNCHAAVETNRGNDLGRVLYDGSTEPDTGVPGEMTGKTIERVIRSPIAGIFRSSRDLGVQVKEGEEVGSVSQRSVKCMIDGVLRGLIRDGSNVRENQKIGDIDPRGERENCFRISDKANAVAGGVLEAVMAFANRIG